MKETAPRRLAVLIDAENASHRHAEAIFEEIAKFGEASVRRLYGDIEEGSVRPWMDKLAPLSIAPYHQPKNSVGKNASDIALAIDAMDLLHSGRFQGIVLVSSDSDFTKLAQRIREQGVDVWGVGKKTTPEAFRMACKQFVFVENLGSKANSVNEQQTTKTNQAGLNKAFQLVSNVLRDTNDSDGWASLAWLGAQLVQRYPDFDARTYGCKNLSNLIRLLDRFEETGTGADHRIRPRPQ